MKNLALRQVIADHSMSVIVSRLRARKTGTRKRLFCLFAWLLIVPVALACVPAIAQDGAASPQPLRFKAAAVAFDPAWGDLDGNIARLVAGLEDVAKQDVRLAGVGWSGYERDRHAAILAYRPDGVGCGRDRAGFG